MAITSLESCKHVFRDKLLGIGVVWNSYGSVRVFNNRSYSPAHVVSYSMRFYP